MQQEQAYRLYVCAEKILDLEQYGQELRVYFIFGFWLLLFCFFWGGEGLLL